MHALHKIHAALVPDGVLVDTQPVSAHPLVAANGDVLGALDMRSWIETIQAVDQRVAETLTGGLYEQTSEQELLVTSAFDDGPDCLGIAGNWQGTRVPPQLADRLALTRDQVALEQQVRIRVFRRAPTSAVAS